jgi:predicted nucleotidyltransferase
MAIQTITSVENRLEAVFGFGSFFRGELFNDLDLLAVAAKNATDNLETYYKLVTAIEPVAAKLGCSLDLTLLTSDEFATRPLMHMDELRRVWAAEA